MQITLRPYVTASVAVIGAALIAITPVVTPDTAQRAPARGSAEPVVLSSFSQVIADVGAILAGLIDPDLAGASAQAADTTAATDLGTGFTTALNNANNYLFGDASLLNSVEANPNDFNTALTNDGDVVNNAGLAALAAGTADTDAGQAVTALSAADPIQVFQDDLQTDWSQLLSDPLSSTMLTDLTATLDAAPAAAQEEIALLLDPAAVGQVTAFEDASGAAEAAAAAQQDYAAVDTAAKAAETAAAAEQAMATSDPTDTATIASENSAALTDLSAAATANGVSATEATDAVNALAGLSPESLSTELAALWTDLQALF